MEYHLNLTKDLISYVYVKQKVYRCDDNICLKIDKVPHIQEFSPFTCNEKKCFPITFKKIDIDFISEDLRQQWKDAFGNTCGDTMSCFAAEICDTNKTFIQQPLNTFHPNEVFLLTFTDDLNRSRFVGALNAVEKKGCIHISSLCIKHEYRSKKLINFFFESLRKYYNHTKFALSVYKGSTDALKKRQENLLKIYERLGFEKTKETAQLIFMETSHPAF